MQNQTEPLSADDEIDLFELFKVLLEAKVLIIACALACFTLATGAAFYMTPKYEGKVIFVSAEAGKGGGGLSALAGQLGGFADLAGVSVGGGTAKDADMAYLKSRSFIERFIKEKDLMPVLYAGAWDAAAKKWKSDDPEKTPTLWSAYNFFSKTLMAVDTDKKTGVSTLTLLWKDREQAALWANELIRRANYDLRERAIEEAQQSLVFLEKELQKTSVSEVQQTIYRVMESQIKNMMLANVREQFAFKIIDPAAPVDEKGFVKPKRPMMMGLGLLGGLFLGILAAFARHAWRNRKARLAAES